MRILHTGDVHLDTPFTGLSFAVAEQRRRDVRASFSAMMKYAHDTDVDMVIISGDLFETSFATRETVAILRRDFSMLSCPVVIAPGNHDPANANGIWSKDLFPENVFVFRSPNITKFSFDELNCDVYGWAFTSSNMTTCPIEGHHPENRSRINILAAHCDITSPLSNKCPVSAATLRDFGADYCALGHIHNPEAANRTLGGAGLYCGCPEGRDFGECGVKGALIADVEKRQVSVNFKRFCKKIYRREEINVDGVCDHAELSGLIEKTVYEKGITGDTLLRVSLTGSVDPSLVIDTKALAQNVIGPFYTEVCDETVPLWNGDMLSCDRGIRGEVYRTLLPSLESPEPTVRARASKALRYALAALNGGNLSDM